MASYRKAKKLAAKTMTVGQAGYCAWKVANGGTCTKAEMAAALTTLWWGVDAVRKTSKKKKSSPSKRKRSP